MLFLTGLVWIVRSKNSERGRVYYLAQRSKNHPSVKRLHVGIAKLMSTAFTSCDQHLSRLGPAPGAGAASFRAGRQRGRARRITLQCISVTFASTKGRCLGSTYDLNSFKFLILWPLQEPGPGPGAPGDDAVRRWGRARRGARAERHRRADVQRRGGRAAVHAGMGARTAACRPGRAGARPLASGRCPGMRPPSNITPYQMQELFVALLALRPGCWLVRNTQVGLLLKMTILGREDRL